MLSQNKNRYVLKTCITISSVVPQVCLKDLRYFAKLLTVVAVRA